MQHIALPTPCFLKDMGLPRWECGRVSNFWQVVLQGSLLFLSRRRTRTRIYIHIPLPPPRSPPSHPADLASLSRTRPACTAITIYFVYGRALKRVESLYTFGRFGFCLHADLPAIFGCWWRALYHFYNVCCFLFSLFIKKVLWNVFRWAHFPISQTRRALRTRITKS